MSLRRARSWGQKPPPGVVINWDDPLAVGLVFAPTFSEAAGSGGGTNVSPGSAASPLVMDSTGRYARGDFGGFVKWAPGRFGPALDFTGTSNEIQFNIGPAGDISDPVDAPFLGALTISCWFYLFSAGANCQIMSKALSSGAGACPFDLRTNSSTRALSFVRGSTGSTFNSYTGPVVSLNTWHHIAVTCSTTLIQTAPIFYIDGVKTTVSNGASTGTVTNGGQLLIGRRADSGVNSNCRIDLPKIWSRALSQGEIQTIMTEWWRPHAPPRTGLRALNAVLSATVPTVGRNLRAYGLVDDEEPLARTPRRRGGGTHAAAHTTRPLLTRVFVQAEAEEDEAPRPRRRLSSSHGFVHTVPSHMYRVLTRTEEEPGAFQRRISPIEVLIPASSITMRTPMMRLWNYDPDEYPDEFFRPLRPSKYHNFEAPLSGISDVFHVKAEFELCGVEGERTWRVAPDLPIRRR